MSTPLSQTIVQFGRVSRHDFEEACSPGDWQPTDITFPQTFPTADVRIILTANDFRVDDRSRNHAVVGVAEDRTPTGFRLWGRNPLECTPSSAGFNWLAIAETTARQRVLNVAVRLGVVQPKFFWRRCQDLDEQRLWGVSFGPNRQIGDPRNPPIVLATATNLNIWATSIEWQEDGGPPYSNSIGDVQNSAVAALVQDPGPAGFVLKAENSDSHYGNSAFFHAALAQVTPGGPDLWVETGRVGAKHFEPDASQGDWRHWDVQFQDPFMTPGGPDLWVETGRVGAKHFEPDANQGDWRHWDVQFQDPFMTPPTVLLTANDLMDDGSPVPDHGGGVAKAVAAVGIAQNVTTHGFTLKARNSDCGAGFAGFDWVAFGCDRFCA